MTDLGTTSTDRIEAWLHTLGRRARSFELLSGDVSNRRYIRVFQADGSRAIIASYPRDGMATFDRFLSTSELLAAAGISVPEVLGASRERGLMLIEDVGPQTLFEWSSGRWFHGLMPYYRDALRQLGKIQSLPSATVAALNPPLDRRLFERELEQTWRVFLEPQGLNADRALTGRLRLGLEQTCAFLGAAPRVPCHRDFMVRNLVPRDDSETVRILDHQDLRLGPRTYDLASLVSDSLFPPDSAKRLLLATALDDHDLLAYHRAGLQRTLKAIGTFMMFAERGNPRHMPLVGPTLARSLEHMAQVPELATVANELRGEWQGLLLGQTVPQIRGSSRP